MQIILLLFVSLQTSCNRTTYMRDYKSLSLPYHLNEVQEELSFVSSFSTAQPPPRTTVCSLEMPIQVAYVCCHFRCHVWGASSCCRNCACKRNCCLQRQKNPTNQTKSSSLPSNPTPDTQKMVTGSKQDFEYSWTTNSSKMKSNFISISCLLWNGLLPRDTLVLEALAGHAETLVFEWALLAALMCVSGCVSERSL